MGTTITKSGIEFSDWILIIQAVILFIGLGFTAFSIRSNKSDNRKMSTIDLILRQRSNKELNLAIDLVGGLVDQDEYPSLHEFLDREKYPEERKAILSVLNYREFVAAGINTGIIDEEIYKRSYYNILMRDWKYLKNTIMAIRTSKKGKDTHFQEFEILVKRWQKKPLKNLV